jgi:hypothetical protein
MMCFTLQRRVVRAVVSDDYSGSNDPLRQYIHNL